MSTSFNEKFDQHGVWRREFALHLKLLTQWLQDQDLLDAGVQDQLQRLHAQLRVDRVMVAFVAEFSRGKSELINAVFFAGYGRRIMPASAGRTTMCPTEMGYDPELEPCLRLLPIETRLQPQSLMEWRLRPEQWVRTKLDVTNPRQLAEALAQVAQTLWVPLEQARALGFWHDDNAQGGNPIPNAQGLVEVPRWRHALINIAHPLLKQGLVILDTPGLNAVGAEPELTVSLIAQAQAVVFILGADTGVTQSDLAIWREHLAGADTRFVVLNKIDTLWDAIDSADEVQAQLQRQQAQCAQMLGVADEAVLAVSAQKGLLGKLRKQPELLARSNLAALEDALSQGVMGQRQRILSRAVAQRIEAVRQDSRRVLQIRRRDVTEQALELRALQGKNAPVIRNMRARVAQEQAEFDAAGGKIHAVRSVHLKLLREIFALLGAATLQADMTELTTALAGPGVKLGLKPLYAQSFARQRQHYDAVQAKVSEIHSMLQAMFVQLNTEYGFSLQSPLPPDLAAQRRELAHIEHTHVQYLGLSNAWRLMQREFVQRLVRALGTRLRGVNESALAEIEAWSKSAAAQLDAQLRERRRNFARRLEAIDRIDGAAQGLLERVAEVERRGQALDQVEAKLIELTDGLLALCTPQRWGRSEA
ncbi:MAG: dynamin-like GTPase family protein [Rhodoferax sp.]